MKMFICAFLYVILNFYILFFSVDDDFALDKISQKGKNVIERQGFVLPALGAPFIAAALPAAGVAAVGIYGAYGDDIAELFNSFLSKSMLDLFCREINKLVLIVC